ncbi:hypothetical protein Xkoz_03649 [Xenorhabdus kozodoii]|uniref:Uncharacterized protein n=1 Tax=Xenorhabdus kozodoii TaxID=351676 RepID=A0A2D0KZ06_9GAMM|nr:hypothetical protein Xkoz_03649 [Xenorhabdus kozodoii]
MVDNSDRVGRLCGLRLKPLVDKRPLREIDLGGIELHQQLLSLCYRQDGDIPYCLLRVVNQGIDQTADGGCQIGVDALRRNAGYGQGTEQETVA